MAFDDTQLGVTDRRLLGPVVGDDDRAVILGCTSAGLRAPWRLRLHIVVEVFETFRPLARRTAATFAR
ncbi:MAG: hypothetical protein DI568_16000 [Sphingomonas sp.]|nr:MAG: hypothetical protein DI568_16000 [Sphingomonas sp.]